MLSFLHACLPLLLWSLATLAAVFGGTIVYLVAVGRWTSIRDAIIAICASFAIAVMALWMLQHHVIALLPEIAFCNVLMWQMFGGYLNRRINAELQRRKSLGMLGRR